MSHSPHDQQRIYKLESRRYSHTESRNERLIECLLGFKVLVPSGYRRILSQPPELCVERARHDDLAIHRKTESNLDPKLTAVHSRQRQLLL